MTGSGGQIEAAESVPCIQGQSSTHGVNLESDRCMPNQQPACLPGPAFQVPAVFVCLLCKSQPRERASPWSRARSLTLSTERLDCQPAVSILSVCAPVSQRPGCRPLFNTPLSITTSHPTLRDAPRTERRDDNPTALPPPTEHSAFAARSTDGL